MSRLSDSRDPNGIGILILQHRNYDKAQFSLDLRGGLIGVRVLDRNDLSGQKDSVGLGSWQYDPDSPGDINLALLWPNETNKRPIPGWAFAWPVIVQPEPGKKNDVETPTKKSEKSECGVGPSNINANPIGNSKYEADERFKTKTFQNLNTGDKSYPERDGKKVWPKFPTDYIGIALTTTEEHTQTELFISGDPRTFAVHNGGDPEMGSLMGDVGSDMKIDPTRLCRYQSFFWPIKLPIGIVDFFGKNSIAWNISPSKCEDVRGGLVIDRPTEGRFTTQAQGDKNRVLGMASTFESGPFDVGGQSDVHNIGVDADGRKINALHLSTETYFKRGAEDGPLTFTRFEPGQDFQNTANVYLGFDLTQTHDFIGGSKPGKWNWYTKVPDYIPNRPPVETPTSVFREFRDRIPPLLQPLDVAGRAQSYLARISDSAFGSILLRPQLIVTGVPDFRKTVNGVNNSLINQLDNVTPVVARIEPWGFQRGAQWVYTDSPGQSRFVGGTSNGGFIVLPAEVDMADQGTSFAPTARSKSTVYMAVLQSNFFGAGLPDITTGAMKSGYRWGTNSNQRLIFEALDSTGATRTAVTMDSSANVGVNTTAPANVFHVASTSVRIDLTIDASGGGSAATLDTIGGSGPTTARQNAWARWNHNGTTYWVPVWT